MLTALAKKKMHKWDTHIGRTLAIVACCFGLHAVAYSVNDQRTVTVGELVELMREQSYDYSATSNSARLQATIFLTLAEREQDSAHQHNHVFIPYDVWFDAFIHARQIAPDDAPLFMRLAHDHAQSILIDCHPDQTIKRVIQGSRPQRAVGVMMSWPEQTVDGNRAEKSFSYVDWDATPVLEVTNNRVITYRLLDFGDVVVMDNINGVLGRPRSGVLGMMFKAIGKGHLVESRMTFADDGRQLNRVLAKKFGFRKDVSVTIQPSGNVTHGIDVDLTSLATRLYSPLKIRYRPFSIDTN